MKKYKHQLVVHITSEVDKGQRQMQDRLLRWLAANGHTSVGHGFTFTGVGVITNKMPHMMRSEDDSED